MRLTRKSWRVLEGDIHNIDSHSILSAAEAKPGEIDVLFGGPPCQPFSKSSYWARGDALRLDDPRAGTLVAYLRVLRDLRPRAFLLENVQGLAFKEKDEGLRCLLEGVAVINREVGTRYEVSFECLNAAAFGVPQLRHRVFLVASRDGRAFRFPRPTHASIPGETLFDQGLEPYRTAWDAIGDIGDDVNPALVVEGKWGKLLPSVPEGENYLWHSDRGGGEPLFGWRRRYWNFLLKLAKSKPSWTIQASPGTATGPFHWKNRRLSAHELCRLQTFPDSLRFDCSHRDVQRMLGNAVPSLLGEVLAREIRTQLLDSKPRSSKPKLLPARRHDTPGPEPYEPVAPEYLHLVGTHESHPGEGLGPGAMRPFVDEHQRHLGE
jgi:DNA (cytosine-5)-methyltransferase 1